MSDDTPEDPKKNGKKKADEQVHPDALVEPVPKRKDFFDWIEETFNDGMPEKMDLRIVFGKNLATMGPILEQWNFAPNAPKPSKEKIVALSNKALYLAQRDCDQHRKPVAYQFGATHLNRGDEPYYKRWIIRCQPSATFANGADGESKDEDSEEDGMEKRFSTQVLRHQENMIGLLGAGFEGQLDRQDRLVERLLARIAKLEEDNDRLKDMLERALSNQAERQERLEMTRLKTKATEQLLEWGLQVAPPLVNQLVGKPLLPSTAPDLEILTLKKFFDSLTKEETNAIFGVWTDDQPPVCVTKGILNEQQTAILTHVTMGQMPSENLNHLLPGGDHTVTMEQAAQLQTVVPMQKLAPVMMLLQARLQNAQKARQQSQQQNPATKPPTDGANT